MTDSGYRMNESPPREGRDAVDYYLELYDRFPFIQYLEDPFADDDICCWEDLAQRISAGIKVVGDDLLSTSPKLLSRRSQLCSAAVVKPNQAGSFTRAAEFVRAAHAQSIECILSDRSGEIWDPYLTAFGAGVGISRAKCAGFHHDGCYHLNSLLRIEENLNDG